jgi:hypothetical protein
MACCGTALANSVQNVAVARPRTVKMVRERMNKCLLHNKLMRGTVFSRINKLQAKACSTSVCMMCVSSHFFADMDISELCDIHINKNRSFW